MRREKTQENNLNLFGTLSQNLRLSMPLNFINEPKNENINN